MRAQVDFSGVFSTELLAIAAAVVAPLMLLRGEKFFRGCLGTLGSLFGGYAAFYVLRAIDDSASKSGIGDVPQWAFLLVTIICCVAGAAILVRLVKLGVFVLGATAGWLSASMIYHLGVRLLGNPPNPTLALWLTALGCAVVAGLLASYLFFKIVVPVAMAFVGGYLASAALGYLLFRAGACDSAPLSPDRFFWAQPEQQGFTVNDFACRDTPCWVLLALWILLFAASIYYQLRILGSKKHTSQQGMFEA